MGPHRSARFSEGDTNEQIPLDVQAPETPSRSSEGDVANIGDVTAPLRIQRTLVVDDSTPTLDAGQTLTLDEQLDYLGTALRMMDELLAPDRGASMLNTSIGQASTEAESWEQLCSVMSSCSLQPSNSLMQPSTLSGTDDAASLLQPSTDTLAGRSLELPWWSMDEESQELPTGSANTSQCNASATLPPQGVAGYGQRAAGARRINRSLDSSSTLDGIDALAIHQRLRPEPPSGLRESFIAPHPVERQILPLTPRLRTGSQRLLPMRPAPGPLKRQEHVGKACHVRSIDKFLDKTPRGK